MESLVCEMVWSSHGLSLAGADVLAGDNSPESSAQTCSALAGCGDCCCCCLLSERRNNLLDILE